jgi:hypothetical protein
MSVALAAPVVTGPLSSELVDVDKSEKELETEPSRSKKARVE